MAKNALTFEVEDNQTIWLNCEFARIPGFVSSKTGRTIFLFTAPVKDFELRAKR